MCTPQQSIYYLHSRQILSLPEFVFISSFEKSTISDNGSTVTQKLYCTSYYLHSKTMNPNKPL